MVSMTNACDASTNCTRCGAAFRCMPDSDCWCKELPPIVPDPDATACLCPSCLERESASRRAHAPAVAK